MTLADYLTLPLVQRAFLSCLLVSVACGVVGTFVVVKRLASISGGLSHAAFGGIGLAYWLGFNPIAGAMAFACSCAAGIGYVYRRYHHGLDTLTAIVWALGMSLGMIFVSLKPGYAPELSSYLFGSILFVPKSFIYLALGLDVVILLVVGLLFKELQAASFDEEFTEITGVPVGGILLLLLILCAATVIVLMRVAGAILTIALLTTPAATAQYWCKSLKSMMVFAVIISAVASVSGLVLSQILAASLAAEVPTGPLIVVVLISLYVLSLALRSLLHRT